MRTKEKFSDDELYRIAKEHAVEFTSVNHWNAFAKEHNLPHSQTFIQRFGKWNDLKEKLGLHKNPRHRPAVYNEQSLRAILDEHKSQYVSIQKWNQYASKNKLPNHEVFERILGISALEEILEHPLVIRKDSLKHYMLKYFPNKPPTMREWNDLAKVNKLPAANTFVLHYGSWSKMKLEIYGTSEECFGKPYRIQA